MISSVKAVLLDADGVVQAPSEPIQRSLGGLVGPDQDAAAFVADVFAAEAPCLTSRDCNFETALKGVLDKWRLDVTIEEALVVWRMIDPAEDILALVPQLRGKGYKVCLATNQQSHRADHMADVLGYTELFDELFVSCDIGSAKPHHDYFRYIVGVLEIEPGECLFVDDHEKNVASARDFGMRAEQFYLGEGLDRFVELLEGHEIVI